MWDEIGDRTVRRLVGRLVFINMSVVVCMYFISVGIYWQDNGISNSLLYGQWEKHQRESCNVSES